MYKKLSYGAKFKVILSGTGTGQFLLIIICSLVSILRVGVLQPER